MSERSITSIAMIIARLAWMIIGPLALVLLLSAVVRSTHGWLGAADVGFFGVLAAMIACRLYEFRTGNALTADGEPMTRAVMARYSFALIVIALVIWVGTKLFALGML